MHHTCATNASPTPGSSSGSGQGSSGSTSDLGRSCKNRCKHLLFLRSRLWTGTLPVDIRRCDASVPLVGNTTCFGNRAHGMMRASLIARPPVEPWSAPRIGISEALVVPVLRSTLASGCSRAFVDVPGLGPMDLVNPDRFYMLCFEWNSAQACN